MIKADNIFKILELMEQLRDVLRQTAPLHKFDSQQSDKVRQAIQHVKNLLNELEESV